MAGEEKYLEKDLKNVLREMSKAPGGNVAQPRPVVPGGITGGPRGRGTPLAGSDPSMPPRTIRDPAIDLFRFYAYGVERPSNLPSPPPDTKKVEVTEIPLTQKEKVIRATAKKDKRLIKETEERKAIRQGIREGTVSGMTRPIGSKPPLNLPVTSEVLSERARRRAEADIIRDALHRAFGAPGAEAPEFKGKYTPELSKITPLSREEQKYLDTLQRKIQDAILDREAVLKERLAARGQTTPTLQEVIATRQADERTLEGRQVAERARLARQKLEKSLIDKSKPPVAPKVSGGVVGGGIGNMPGQGFGGGLINPVT